MKKNDFLKFKCPACEGEGEGWNDTEGTDSWTCNYCHGTGKVGLLKWLWYYFSQGCNNE